MFGDKEIYEGLFPGNIDCLRPRGGRCVGNCRRIDSNIDCLRPRGGNCVGNCRKTGGLLELDW